MLNAGVGCMQVQGRRERGIPYIPTAVVLEPAHGFGVGLIALWYLCCCPYQILSPDTYCSSYNYIYLEFVHFI